MKIIIPTPVQSEKVLKTLNTDCYDGLIMGRYTGYEVCFVAFHPFLRIKEGHENRINFNQDAFPSSKLIQEHCERLSWTEFIKISGIKDYKSLDEALSFYHYTHHYGNKSEFEKLLKTLKDNKNIITPFVDELPEIFEKVLFDYLVKLGYSEVYIYTDIEDKSTLSNISDLVTKENKLPHHIRIETPDNQILIAQDFDQRFTYFFGKKAVIAELVDGLELEGFYCDENTMGCWSYDEIPATEKIDWEYLRALL